MVNVFLLLSLVMMAPFCCRSRARQSVGTAASNPVGISSCLPRDKVAGG
jgi:hypothetical protein